MTVQRALHRVRSAAVIGAGLVLFAAPAAAQSAGQWRDGDHVYSKVCSYCHETGIGPRIKGRQLPTVYITHVVRNGFKAMPAFRASDIDDATLADLARRINESRVAQNSGGQ